MSGQACFYFVPRTWLLIVPYLVKSMLFSCVRCNVLFFPNSVALVWHTVLVFNAGRALQRC